MLPNVEEASTRTYLTSPQQIPLMRTHEKWTGTRSLWESQLSEILYGVTQRVPYRDGHSKLGPANKGTQPPLRSRQSTALEDLSKQRFACFLNLDKLQGQLAVTGLVFVTRTSGLKDSRGLRSLSQLMRAMKM